MESCSSCSDAGYGYSGYSTTGSCPGGVCPTDSYSWGNEYQGYLPLFRNGVQIGGFYTTGFWSGQYLGLTNGRWDNIDSDLPCNLPTQYTGQWVGRKGQVGSKPMEPKQSAPGQPQPFNPPIGSGVNQVPAQPSQQPTGDVLKQLEEMRSSLAELKKQNEVLRGKTQQSFEQGPAREEPLLTGVDKQGLVADARNPGTTINGIKAADKMAYSIIDNNGWGGAGDIPDFSGKHRLTIVGSEQDRAEALKVIKDMFPLGLTDIVVKDYPPNASLLTQVGFPTEGAPGIVFQNPAGTVEWRLVGTNGLQARLAQWRKPDGGYRPERDPVGPPLFADADSVAPYVVGGVALLIVCMAGVGIILHLVNSTNTTEQKQWHGY